MLNGKETQHTKQRIFKDRKNSVDLHLIKSLILYPCFRNFVWHNSQQIRLCNSKKQPTWIREKCRFHGHTSYKTRGCNLWNSLSVKEILTIVLCLSISIVHAMFDLCNERGFWKKESIYKSLIGKLAFFS